MSHLNKHNNRHKTKKYNNSNSIDQMHAQKFGKCHYCDEYGHFEDTCPLVEKAAQEHNCKKNVSKEPLGNPLTNTKQTNKGSKSITCTMCDSLRHTTDEHRRMKYLEDTYSILVNLNDYCGICEERGHEMFDCKKFNEAKSKDTQESIMTPIIKENKSDQEQQEYKSGSENSEENPFVEEACFICKEYGHNTNYCPVVINLGPEQHEYDKQWYTRQRNKEQKENNFKNSNNRDLEDKKCKKCNKNGHAEDSCYSGGKKQEKFSPKKNSNTRSGEQSSTSKKSHPEFKKIFFPMNQKSIYLNENGKFLKICTVHCVCEMCHTKYSSKLNKNATEDHAIDKGPDDDAIRCCFMCGANGLIDSCFW